MAKAEMSADFQDRLNNELMPAKEFVTTNWSMVVRAGARGSLPSQSLAELCELYWFPLYATLRQRGACSHDAEDMVQEFFGWLVANDVVGRADQNRGRFRVFLQVALRQFCAREYRKGNAQKRRPAQNLISLNAVDAESRFENAMVSQLTPERIFDHSWAMMMLDRSMNQLRAEYDRTGRSDRFRLLVPFLSDDRRTGRDEISRQLGMSETAFAMALVRLRRRFGKILHDEISRTVSDPEDVEDEMIQIWSALSKN